MPSGPEDKQQQDPRPGASVATWGLGVALAALLIVALFGDRGMVRAYDLYRQKLALEEEIRALHRESQALRQEITLLQNPKSPQIELVARTELGMVRDNELVYQFPPN